MLPPVRTLVLVLLSAGLLAMLIMAGVLRATSRGAAPVAEPQGSRAARLPAVLPKPVPVGLPVTRLVGGEVIVDSPYFGGTGGDAFTDNDGSVDFSQRSLSLMKFYVGGMYLGRIQMVYKTTAQSSAQPQMHGGGSGPEVDQPLDDNEFVSGVTICHGWYVNSVVFHTTQFDPNSGTTQPGRSLGPFGHGGHPGWDPTDSFAPTNPDGTPMELRFISGRAYGWMDGLQFHFGRVISSYKVVDFKYDFSGGYQNASNPEIGGRQVCNNMLNSTVTCDTSVEVAYSTTYSYSFGTSFAFGVSVSVSAGIPEIFEASLTVSTTTTFDWNQGKDVTTTDSVTSSVAVPVPALSNVEVDFLVQKASVDVPFTATAVTQYRDGGVDKTPINGSFKGVLFVTTLIQTRAV